MVSLCYASLTRKRPTRPYNARWPVQTKNRPEVRRLGTQIGIEVRGVDVKTLEKACGAYEIQYGVRPDSLMSLVQPPAGKPFDLADVYRELVATNELAGYEVSQRFYEIGSPEGLAEIDQVTCHL